MPSSHAIYRSLVRLYPRDFRQEYGRDLVQHHADLVTGRGLRAAWTLTGIDLIVTLPRYRLETLMNEQRSTTALTAAITLLATGGVVSVLAGLYPGVLLLGAAILLAVAQRSALARAIRTPDSNQRRRRLGTAMVLAVIFVVCYGVYVLVIGDRWTLRETALALVGTTAMVGAVVFAIVGVLTPRSADADAHRGMPVV
ncbi:MAG: DUF3040 domain-containing protein [Mycobacteriales bacterium]